MRMRQNIKTVLKSLAIVFGGAAMSAITIAVIYCLLWLLKQISLKLVWVCDYIIGFIITNWSSTLVIIAALAVGVVEFNLLVSKISSLRSKDSADNFVEKTYKVEDATEEALAFLQAFEPDMED